MSIARAVGLTLPIVLKENLKKNKNMFNPPIFWQLCHPLCGPQIALGLRDFASETPPCCLLCLGDVGMNQHNLWMESAE